MPLLSEGLSYPFKQFSLPRILLRMTQQHTALGQCICCRLPERLESQHAGRNDRYILNGARNSRRIVDLLKKQTVASVM
jgi:hypothetical protein